MKRNNISVTEDKDLVIQTRIWFSLYLFEHQYVCAAQIPEPMLTVPQVVIWNRTPRYSER